MRGPLNWSKNHFKGTLETNGAQAEKQRAGLARRFRLPRRFVAFQPSLNGDAACHGEQGCGQQRMGRPNLCRQTEIPKSDRGNKRHYQCYEENSHSIGSNIQMYAGVMRKVPGFSWTAARLFRKHYRLHARNFEPFAATHILAGHKIVAPQHVRTRFGKLGAVAIIGAAGQLLFLGADQPRNLVFARLLAVGAIEHGHFLFLPLVKKFALVHNR
ncbi:MAG TPA: hypothetical protein VF753_15185 [Terriglobales bacterium]